MTQQTDVPSTILRRLRSICRALPEAHEERAWVGIRWRVGTRTFCHVLLVEHGWPPAYARATTTDGPAVVVAFRSSGPELDALRNTSHPVFGPPWRADEVLMVLEPDVDWDEVAELLTESYLLLAPERLRRRAEPGRPEHGIDVSPDGGRSSRRP